MTEILPSVGLLAPCCGFELHVVSYMKTKKVLLLKFIFRVVGRTIRQRKKGQSKNSVIENIYYMRPPIHKILETSCYKPQFTK